MEFMAKLGFFLLQLDLLFVETMRTEFSFYLCNILTCTIFHYLTRENIKTRPIPIRPLGCAIRVK